MASIGVRRQHVDGVLGGLRPQALGAALRASRSSRSAMFFTCMPGGSVSTGPASNCAIVAPGACSLRIRA